MARHAGQSINQAGLWFQSDIDVSLQASLLPWSEWPTEVGQ